jgi:hypothetical protein
MISIRASRSALAAALILGLPAAAWAQGTGLYGEYYNNPDFSGTRVTKLDGPINIVWVATTIPVVTPALPPLPVTPMPAGITSTTFSVRWRGRIDVPLAGDWIFKMRGDDGIRLYIDGVLRINGWRDQGLTTSYNVTLTGLTLGKHDIMIEHYQGSGDAGVQLTWDPPGAGVEEVVPVSALYADIDDTAPSALIPEIATPLISPNTGAPPQNVTISTTTGGAQIYYTTNGSDPGPSVPLGTATLYTVPFAVADYTKVVARAYLTGTDFVPSESAAATFSPTFAGVSAPDAVAGGVFYRYFNTATGLFALPDFSTLAHRGQGLSTAVDELPTKERTNDYGFVFTGYLNVTAAQAGTFTFYLNGHAGMKLFLQNKLVVDNDGLKSLDGERSGSIALLAGLHPLRVEFWRRDQGTSPGNLEFRWEQPTATPAIAKAIVPAASLYTEPITPTPTITPGSSAITGTQVVALESTHPGAILYYSLDGSFPTNMLANGSGLSPINLTLSSAITVRVVAYSPQRNPSSFASATYTLNAPATQPALQTVVASSGNNEVVVAFDRPIGTGATTLANYQLTDGATPLNVTGATLIPKTGVLLGHWPLQTAGTGDDATGNNATPLTFTNAVTSADVPVTLGGATDASLTFNGVDSQATAPNGPMVNVASGSFTVSLWFKTNNLTTRQRLISKYQGITNAPPTVNTDPTGGWNIDLNTGANDVAANGSIRVHLKAPRSADRQDSVFVPTTALVADTWYHLAARIDRRTNQLALFLNGTQVGATVSFFTSANSLSDMALTPTNPVFALGTIPSNPGFFFDGKMDEVRLYRIALTTQEIAELAAGRSDLTRAVKLTTDTMTTGVDYTLTVNNVQDRLGNAITAPGAVRKFRYIAGGTVHREVYGNPSPTVTGSTIPDLTRNALFPNSAASGNAMTDVLFGVAGASTDILNDYGTRIRGYFIPTSTDNWIFSVAGDDGTQLWISPNEDPSCAYLVSRVNGSSTNSTFYGHATTTTGNALYQSGPSNGTQTNLGITIPMVAAQKYYMELLHKEGTGNDYLSLTAKPAGGAPTPIASGSTPLGTAFLSGFAEAPLITTQPLSRVVTPGASVTFTAAATGTAARSFEWFHGAVSVGTGTSFTIPSVSTADTGNYTVEVTAASGIGGKTVSNVATIVINDFAATPTFVSIVPSGGPTAGGNTVTINGTNFVPSYTTVTFGGVSAANVVVAGNGLSLTCVAPARPASTVTVVIGTPAGFVTTNYTYVSGPTVTSISPAHGPVTGTQSVTIGGTGFLAGQTSVTIGGIAATAVNVTSTISLTCTRPAGSIQDAVDVAVTTPGGTGTLVDGYNYWNVPTLASTSPAAGNVAGGNTITLTGTNFVAGQTSVTIRGVTAGNPQVSSLTTMTCVVPGPTTAGPAAVVVTTPGGDSVQAVNYQYMNAPTLSGLNPTNGPDDGGQVVTLTGTNFVVGATTVNFGAFTLPATVDVGLTTATVTSPDGTGLNGVNVTVTTSGGTSGAQTYTYLANPTISLISPTDGPQGGGTSVTITGTGFVVGQTTVTFGANAPVSAVVAVNGLSLTVSTPNNGAGGSVGVLVTTPGGNSTPVANGFTYHAPPTVTTFTPPSGTANGGTTVTINGTNFPVGKTSVTFDGLAATSVVASGSSLTCVTPAHAPGTASIVVTTPGGFDTAATLYTYTGPFISSINPSSGLAVGGQTITINGINLNPGPAATTVTIGVNNAPITSNTGTVIQATIPAGTAGTTVQLTVTTPDGTYSVSFTYVNPPAISTVTLNQGPTGGGQSVTIVGTDFVAGQTTVTFGGAAATITNQTGTTQLVVTTPARPAGNADVVVTTFGTQPSAAAAYNYVSPPTASALSPIRGPINGSQTVTITGTNFVLGQTEVLVDGAPVAGNVSSSTLLTFTTPAHAAGAATIVVRTFNPPGQSSGSLPYTYVDPATSVDLSLLMSVDDLFPSVGQDVTFTLSLNNAAGGIAGSGITVTDILPAGLTYVTHTASIGTFTPATGVWNVGALAVNTTVTLNLVATVNSSAVMINSAEVSAAGQGDVDSIPANGLAGEDDLATASVQASLAITTSATLPSGTSRAFYSTTLAALGGTPPYAWSLADPLDVLPFNLDPATGVISGFAPNVGIATVYSFDITVSDSGATPLTDTQPFSITINPATVAAPAINAAPAAPNAVVGQQYGHTFTANGGAAPYTWRVTVGTLPLGLALNPFTGVLAGTPTTAVAASFSVVAKSTGGLDSAALAVSFTVAANPITFLTPAALPNATEGADYAQFPEVSGGVGPFTWTVSAGVKPAWLALAFSGRRASLIGKAPASSAGVAVAFTLQVADAGQSINATRAFTFTIAATGAPIAVTPTVFPSGTVLIPYPAGVSVSGTGGNASYFWTITGGALPTGLSLNPGSGVISGTPQAAGTFSFTVQAAQFGGGVTPGTGTLSITIAPAPTLTTPLTLPAAVQGSGYFAPLTLAGGASPIAWSGTPPNGLTLDAQTGTLQGTPIVSGPQAFTLTATDVNGAAVSGNFTMTIAPTPVALAVVSTTLPRGQVGVPYSGAVFAAGGTTPYTWSTGALPAGLTLSPSTGAITGTPVAASSTALTFQVTDNVAATANSVSITLNIDAALTITTATLPLAGVSSPYGATLSSTGGVGALVWDLTSGTLPAGMTLSPTGVLGGTLTATAVTSSFQVRVTDSVGRSDTQSYTITVGPAIIPPSGGGGSSGGGGCGGSIGLGTMPFGALTSLAALLALATRRRRKA